MPESGLTGEVSQALLALDHCWQCLSSLPLSGSLVPLVCRMHGSDWACFCLIPGLPSANLQGVSSGPGVWCLARRAPLNDDDIIFVFWPIVGVLLCIVVFGFLIASEWEHAWTDWLAQPSVRIRHVRYINKCSL